MSDVFIVTSTDYQYAGVSILAVFTDKEKADVFAFMQEHKTRGSGLVIDVIGMEINTGFDPIQAMFSDYLF